MARRELGASVTASLAFGLRVAPFKVDGAEALRIVPVTAAAVWLVAMHSRVTSALAWCRQWDDGGDERVFESDCAGADEMNAAPDAGVAATDGGYPVPANGGVVGGVVRAGGAAVFACAFEGLLLAARREWRF